MHVLFIVEVRYKEIVIVGWIVAMVSMLVCIITMFVFEYK